MRGTVPILTCDYDGICDEWIVDYYEMGVTDFRHTLDGWAYDPHRDRETAFCPEHAPQSPDQGGTS